MMTVLSISKIKHYHSHTSFSLLHNGCVLQVNMKTYRLNFYYQIIEQLHGKTKGTVMTLGSSQGSGRSWVLGDFWE